MAYITLSELIKRVPERDLIQLTDWDHVGVMNTDRITRTIADVEAMIDGYLRSRYVVPLDPVPQEITRAAAIMVEYDLHGDFRTPSESLAQRYNGVIAWLKDLAAGRATLVRPEEEEVVAPTSPIVVVSGSTRRFTEDMWSRYR